MDLPTLIDHAIEFSEKRQQEFPNEAANFKVVLVALKEKLQQTNQNQLPPYIITTLEQTLSETNVILAKSPAKSGSWWVRIRNMLPGSDRWRFKKKIQEIVHLNKVLDVHAGMLDKRKRSSLSFLKLEARDFYDPSPVKRIKTSMHFDNKPLLNFSLIPPQRLSKSVSTPMDIYETLDDNFQPRDRKLTDQMLSQNDDDLFQTGDLAFRLKLLYDYRLMQAVRYSKTLKTMIQRNWGNRGQVTYTFQRGDFPYFPAVEAQKLSREHAIVIATREEEYKEEEEKVEKIVNGDVEEVIVNEEETVVYKYRYKLRNLSLNGTYYLSREKLTKDSLVAEGKVMGEFRMIGKNEEVDLNHGDVISLIIQKPKCQDLVFGFQFLTE